MKRVTLIALILITVNPAYAELSASEKAMLDRINNDPSLREEAIARLSKKAKNRVRTTSVVPGKAVTPDQRSTTSTPDRKPTPFSEQQSPCAGLSLLIRQDWTDIDLTECPGDAKKATGAQISVTNDLANGNRIWAVDGTAAINFNSLMAPSAWWQPTYLNLGAYASIDRSFNSASKFTSSDIDKAAYGAFAQVGYTSDYLQNFFRLRGGVVENNIKNTTAAAFTGEYIPVVDFLYIHYPTNPIFGMFRLRFDPTAFAQYSEVTGKNQVLILNNRTEAFLVGLEGTLRLLPDLGASSLVRLHADMTYRWAQETYSGKKLSWFQFDVGYNLDPEGHISIGLTYKRGNDADTGAFENVYKAGLTGKL